MAMVATTIATVLIDDKRRFLNNRLVSLQLLNSLAEKHLTFTPSLQPLNSIQLHEDKENGHGSYIFYFYDDFFFHFESCMHRAVKVSSLLPLRIFP